MLDYNSPITREERLAYKKPMTIEETFDAHKKYAVDRGYDKPNNQSIGVGPLLAEILIEDSVTGMGYGVDIKIGDHHGFLDFLGDLLALYREKHKEEIDEREKTLYGEKK